VINELCFFINITVLVSAITSDTFNISVVNREHMGEYACNADNGIPPAKSKKFKLQVRCKHVSILFNYLIYIYIYIYIYI